MERKKEKQFHCVTHKVEEGYKHARTHSCIFIEIRGIVCMALFVCLLVCLCECANCEVKMNFIKFKIGQHFPKFFGSIFGIAKLWINKLIFVFEIQTGKKPLKRREFHKRNQTQSLM